MKDWKVGDWAYLNLRTRWTNYGKYRVQIKKLNTQPKLPEYDPMASVYAPDCPDFQQWDCYVKDLEECLS